MQRDNIQKIAQSPEDRVLLAKLWDKIQMGMRKNIPVSTGFLSLREQEMARFLFGAQEGLFFWGGYDQAERKMLIYLPDYMEEASLYDAPPMAYLRAEFYTGDTPSHRDFLGALMGAGIARDTIGDILVGKGSCDFLTSEEIAPYLLQNFTGAGRTKVHMEQISPDALVVPEPETKEIRDTVASLRLDSILSSGFRLGRTAATGCIRAGKAAIDGLPCDKPDKPVEEGASISVRGLGKIRLRTVNGETKKGRISVVIDRYV